MSKVYSIRAVQQMPVSLDTAWDFFSSPHNLEEITPADINFNIISQYHGNKMYAGQVIEYKLKPFLGIPFYWMTEITHVVDNNFFVDEQRFGPYRLWHHQHHFKAIAGGVEMTDIVHYKLPFWFLGDIVHGLFLKQRLKNIFDHRYKIIAQKFGSWEALP